MDCVGKQMIKQGCHFCIVTLPCQCTLLTEKLFLPPTLTHCKKSDNISIVHQTNLALLQQFFNLDLLGNIQANSTFEKPLDIQVPSFKIYNHSFSQFLSEDIKSH